MRSNQSLLSVQSNAGITFRSCRKEAGVFGLYQKRMFVIMGLYWITASCFLILPFFIFKKQKFIGQFDTSCVNKICSLPLDQIKSNAQPQQTLTYNFALYCNKQWVRIIFKIAPEAISWIGLLIYGFIADSKGRKVAFKISWRFYTVGLIFFTTTETQFLVSFGYLFACVNCFPSLVIQFILLFEQVDREHRLRACLLLLIFLFIGPLFGSFFASQMLNLGYKLTLLILCTIPALILSFFTGYLQQSAVFVYKQNKILAFNLLNQIAKVNKLSPILIDFTKSSWIHYEDYTYSYLQILKHQLTKKKCYLGVLFIFSFFYNTRVAQKSLDDFTNNEFRGQIMNGASAIATLSVVFVLIKWQMKPFTQIIVLFTLVVTLLMTILIAVGVNNVWVQTITAVALRFFSSISYSIFVIWVMEAFPTVCRAKCLALVLSSCSFAIILVYLVFEGEISLFITALILNVIVVLFFHKLEFPNNSKLVDTLKGNYYDSNDYFHKLI